MSVVCNIDFFNISDVNQLPNICNVFFLLFKDSVRWDEHLTKIGKDFIEQSRGPLSNVCPYIFPVKNNFY